jgi:hypothetical protein
MDMVGGIIRSPVDIVEPGVHRVLIKNGIFLRQIELSSKKGIPARGIDDQLTFQIDLVFADTYSYTTSLVIVKQHLLYVDALVYFGTQRLGVFEQQEIEFSAIYVIGIVLINPLLGEFTKLYGELASMRRSMPGGPVFSNETLSLHSFQETDLFEHSGRGSNHRLANVCSGMIGALEYGVADACHGKKASHCRSGRTPTNDYDIAQCFISVICGLTC